jgi:Predicted metal-binding, possibly nucleic acid-binding protein
MPLIVNLRHLEEHNAVMHGELPVDELDMDTRDAMIRVTQPLQYDIEVQKLEGSLLVRGSLQLTLECQCVRCLKPFTHKLELNPWTCHLPLEGEERVAIVNDCVDLTPFAREDMLLEFPRHPLCKLDCGGLKETKTGKARKTVDEIAPSAWAELNKLKL